MDEIECAKWRELHECWLADSFWTDHYGDPYWIRPGVVTFPEWLRRNGYARLAGDWDRLARRLRP